MDASVCMAGVAILVKVSKASKQTPVCGPLEKLRSAGFVWGLTVFHTGT